MTKLSINVKSYLLPWMCTSNVQLHYFGDLNYKRTHLMLQYFYPQRGGRVRSRFSSEPLPNTTAQQLQYLIRQNIFLKAIVIYIDSEELRD